MPKARAEKYLEAEFPTKHVRALIRHFVRMVGEFEKGEWEDSIAKAGKFTEAVLKALAVYAHLDPPTGRGFKVDKVINRLAQASAYDETIRLTIPRACRFVYDVASNRGGRHDPDEIDPNEMDANALVMNCSWVLAEMIRYSQRGAVDIKSAKQLVDALVKKKYPLIEEVEGRTYFHYKGLSALEVALLALAHEHPGRVAADELVSIVRRHKFSSANSRMAVQRIKRYADEDNEGRLRLLAPGLHRGEKIMQEKSYDRQRAKEN